MSGWKEYKFSEVVEISPTISLKSNEKYSFVEMKDLTDGKRYCHPSEERKLSGGSRFQEKDTLFARITPCLENGKICQVRNLKNGIGFGSTEFLVFRGKENLSDNDFIFYLSRSDIVRSYAEQSFDGTSGRQRVPKSTFENLTIAIPSLSEQRAIAAILSSLDDKIDLLHRQNKTLEAMAETLFRQWFVNNDELRMQNDEWKIGKLGDIIKIKHGYAFKGENITAEETDKILVTPGNFNIGGGFKYDKFKYYSSNDFPDDYIFTEGDLIVTMTDLSKEGDTLGYPAFVPYMEQKILLHNQRVGKIIFKTENDKIFKHYIYLIMKTDIYRAYILGSSSGTSIMHSSPDRICNYDLLLPDETDLLKFNGFVESYFQKIQINTKQIRTLEKLRDTLLPKLMSGEVRVAV